MLRDFISKLEKNRQLIKIKKPVSARLEASGILKALDGTPVLFENVRGYNYRVIGNLFSSRALIAQYLKTTPEKLIFRMARAIDKPTKPTLVKNAPCHEVVETGVDLNKIPILFHCAKDGGPYISAGVVVARDSEYGRNCSFHRLMKIEKNKFTLRILPRHLDAFIKRNGGELDVAVAIGNPVNFLLAAATSIELGADETWIANSLEPITIARCKTVDVEVPAQSEFVLEGRITKEAAREGKFVDLTETYDIVREQPVLEVKKITRRRGALYQALLPGAMEHKLLMGMPREPTIYREVSKVCRCENVALTLGGCSWLHAVVQIDKKKEEDGKNAIEAAFRGHHSLKHVAVVDKDIDINRVSEVEWAIATRFQAKTGLVVKLNEKGSSLDPSADPLTRETSKMGIDATAPLQTKGKDFKKAEFPKVKLGKYGVGNVCV
ncbi:MAG: UbiD family decarboxylase [Candidatus Micrarchaeota archaeon]